MPLSEIKRDPAIKCGVSLLFINIYMDRKWTYKNPDTGKDENVVLENWIWGALYEDGTEFHQFTNDGIFHRIGEIDQSKVKMWTLYQPEGKGDGRIDFIMPREDVPEDAPKGTVGALKECALIHKYRNIVFNAGTPQEVRHRIIIFGFKIKGQKSFYNFILPNGNIVQSVDENPKISQFVQ